MMKPARSRVILTGLGLLVLLSLGCVNKGVVAPDGTLTVTFEEAVEGTGPFSYHLQAEVVAEYTCNGAFFGSIEAGGPSWDSPGQNGVFAPLDGTVEGVLTHPLSPLPAEWETPGVCPAGLVLSKAEWRRITVTNLTTGSVLRIPRARFER
jgi:hypothetical protein